ncbi:MAG: mercuric reductase [Cyanobacterium sp. T60_A2020_053]|nr:mercuric reductase [Cyanobacterium sp. T60_A2020_053]
MVKTISIAPMDGYNQQLISYVHPPDWVNPTPKDKYDIVVIGAGTAGLVVAAGAAGLDLGLKVALVERHLMGGDCLNFGCVPSKAVIRSAKVIGEINRAPSLGVTVDGNVNIDFAQVMGRMRKLRAGISHHDSAQRFKDIGIDVFLGDAQFLDNKTITVDGVRLNYKKAVVATGARAVTPKVEGIEEVEFYTNETIFSLTTLPKSLAVIGGGPIGCELAQTFHRLGAQVTIIHKYAHLLNKEDEEAAHIIQTSLINDGVQLQLNAQPTRVENTSEGKKIYYASPEGEKSLIVEAILMGAGRAPNVEALNLEKVGVEYNTRQGIIVNDYLQTTNPKIYAVGDICSPYKFTHTADAGARIVIKNTLFSPFGFGKSKFSDLVIPWVTFTDPEIAHVGSYGKDLDKKGIEYDTIKIPFSTVDRAIVDGEEEGFVKILHQRGSDKILGATIVASHAGEMISEITTAMVNNIGLNGLSSVIHSYPTQADAIKKGADAYRRTLLTPNSKKLLGILTKLS